MTRAVRDLIGAGAILALILAALWVSGSIDIAQFGVTERLSGPRGYPRALLLAGLALGIALVVVTLQATRRHGNDSPADFSIAEPGRPFALLVGLVGFALALDTVGYLIAMIVLLVFCARLYGARRWWQAIAAAIVFTLGSIVLFRFGLDTVLPEGWLGIDAMLGN